jgi:D-3-phosphoglycerate dehydrogenase
MPHKILITFPPMIRHPGRHTELLRESRCNVATSMSDRPLTAHEMLPLVGDVDAIIAGGERIDASVIAAAPRLKIISRHGVGYDNVDVDAASRAGVIVTITPGTNHVAVAELVFGLMISCTRCIPDMRDALRRGDWTRRPGTELAAKTLGIVGLGRIGKAVASRARAFDMNVLAHDVRPDEEFARTHGVKLASLDVLLGDADFISLHTPAAPGATPMIGEAQLQRMKPGAYLINTARGSLIDEAALYRCLADGRIAGAALDVFAIEPPTGNPLLTLDNVLATPHIGGTREAGARTALLATQNALQVLAGERCSHAINPAVYETWKAHT